MGLREDQLKALKFARPERVPVSIAILPAAWMKHRERLAKVLARHPAIFDPRRIPSDFDAVKASATYSEGRHVDAWGCVWSNVQAGMEAIVTGHPVPMREAVWSLAPPKQDVGLPHGFMFLRLADLRGWEELMIDFAEEPPELQRLIDVVLEYNLRQAKRRLNGIREKETIQVFGDDLGMQTSLPISPRTWRKHLKPCYAGVFRPFREAGHYVYLHSDGHILEIIDDLVDCGVNVINPQARANGLQALARACKGKVCVDLDLDRQLFPFCSPSDIDAHVREAVETLGAPEGGLWLKAEIGFDAPLENVEAICAALENHRECFNDSSSRTRQA